MKTTMFVAAICAAFLLGAPIGRAQERQRGRDRDATCLQDCDPDDCTEECPFEQDGQEKAKRKRGGKSGAKGNKKGRSSGKGQRKGNGKRKGKGKGKGKNKGGGDCQRDGSGCDGTGSGQRDGSCNSLDDVESDGTQTVSDDYLARLQGALERELYARDYYLAADAALSGGLPVFGNLARAEQNHADAVANMIRIVGGSPVLVQSVDVEIPTTAAEASAQCTAIELYVIEVYEGLIDDCTDDRILGALESIQASNRRHLAAVDR